ncbi:MAG: protocatechuate 3,4-dioxygenase subunit alpha [Cytophagaceae bacterium]|nr:protocatechuate 3,4-dioxygenase subunit alpha [Gemmatimonadaceae bacterium]
MLTPSQTVGPYFHDALLGCDAFISAEAPGQRVRIVGTVVDGAGEGVPDAMIEAWQGNCFSRVGTGAGGIFEFTTIHPSSAPTDRTTAAPRIDLVIFARGLLNHLVTRIYFPDEHSNERDPVLRLVPPARRATLIAQRGPSHADAREATYRFDIVLQGGDETVFFDVR